MSVFQRGFAHAGGPVGMVLNSGLSAVNRSWMLKRLLRAPGARP